MLQQSAFLFSCFNALKELAVLHWAATCTYMFFPHWMLIPWKVYWKCRFWKPAQWFPDSLFNTHGKSNWWIITVYLLETNMIETQNLSFHLISFQATTFECIMSKTSPRVESFSKPLQQDSLWVGIEFKFWLYFFMRVTNCLVF